MLISFEEIDTVLKQHDIHITGALHIGAHECEEMGFYERLGLKHDDLIWIDAIPSKVKENTEKGISNVYHAVIADEDEKQVDFHVSNNIQSSSLLEFGTHLHEHPHVMYVDKLSMKTTTVDTFFKERKCDPSHYNFWNFDIQGAELMALKGAKESINCVKAMYLEVNERELYKNCGMLEEVDKFLSTYHFKRVITRMTCHGWGDALYLMLG
jgi:FkbM family methyltransferase